MNYQGKALTIAGSDSGGGAGIQADLKTFHAFGVFGMSAITAITAQNTRGVYAVHDVPADIVAAQIDAVMKDMGTDGLKTGMLSNRRIIETIVAKIKEYDIRRVVVDPVMVAKSQDRLLQKEAENALVQDLLPVAFLVTPNAHEAEIISGISIAGIEDAKQAARLIKAKGPTYVLLKGGHLQEDTAIDILFDGETFHYFSADWIDSVNTHGTGCTISAAITACLAKGMAVHDAIETAKDYITRAIIHAPDNIGLGHGPLYHRVEPLQPSAFVAEAADFDRWFDKNRVVFESELLAEKHFLDTPGKAVSIGVGSGLFAARLGISHGVEPAQGMAELARKRGIKVKAGTAEQVPYADGFFDTVLLGTVLTYVKKPQQAMREAFRVLKPGGHIVVSFITRAGSYALLYDLAYLRGRHDPAISPQHPYPVKFIRGAHWYTSAEIDNLLLQAGFKDLQHVQTLTRHPKYSNDEIEQPQPGFDRGDYIVVQGVKP